MTKAQRLIDTAEARFKDEMGKFYVVTKPTKDSELIDILFDADVFSFALQVRGGLKKSDVLLITHDKAKADKLANSLIK